MAESGFQNEKPWLQKWLLPMLLGLTLVVLFIRVFAPGQILFSNDGPLGSKVATENRFPGRFSGTWRPLDWLGGEGPAAALTLSNFTATILSPVTFLKFYAPLTLLFTGLCAWLFFRQLKFSSPVCVLGGLAAGLNMHFFSVACWGQGPWDIAAGMAFLALAALTTPAIKQIWAKAVLAGLAVGMGLMEGFDVGAILSIYVGAFVVFYWATREEPVGRKIFGGVLTETLVIFFAAFLSIHTIVSLVGTQVQGIANAKQDETTKEKRWLPDTQWSLPKLETLQLFVPGLFGYRLNQHIDSPNHASAYWGRVGEDARFFRLESTDAKERAATYAELNLPAAYTDKIENRDAETRISTLANLTLSTGMLQRFVGTGEYAGVTVGLLAFYALASALRRKAQGLSGPERAAVLFWAGAALFSLVTAWGKYGFLYKLLYHLPYFSTIRNPIKFLHPFAIAWIIMAAYGMELLHRRLNQPGAAAAQFLTAHLKNWWSRASRFEKGWIGAMVLLIVISIAGLFFLITSKNSLMQYLVRVGFSVGQASQVVDFSCIQIAWFIGFLVLSAAIIAGMMSRVWTGSKIKWAWIFLGVVLVADLARTDTYWVHYVDYHEKYSSNPILDFLADKPYEHRIIGRLAPFGNGSGVTPEIGQLYYYWLEHDFPFRDIQSLDLTQMPRIPELDRNFYSALQVKGMDLKKSDLFPAIRLWQLTNTRYVIAPSATLDIFNRSWGETHDRLRPITFFSLLPKPDVRAVVDAGDLTVNPAKQGPWVLIDFPDALPRAKLYSSWQVPTNDDEIMPLLASKTFDPMTTVAVSKETPPGHDPTGAGSDPGTVNITDYQPKDIHLQASVKTPAVLLFNDRIAPDWTVRVDGQRAPMLHCNYLMRGVYLSPGEHTVEFQFLPSLKTLYVSGCAIVVGILVAGYVVFTHKSATPKTAPPPAPIPTEAPPPVAEAAKPATPARRNPAKNKRKEVRR
jgi:hypothetical protein